MHVTCWLTSARLAGESAPSTSVSLASCGASSPLTTWSVTPSPGSASIKLDMRMLEAPRCSWTPAEKSAMQLALSSDCSRRRPPTDENAVEGILIMISHAEGGRHMSTLASTSSSVSGRVISVQSHRSITSGLKLLKRAVKTFRSRPPGTPMVRPVSPLPTA